MSWASSVEFQCVFGLCWYKLSQLQIMIAALVNLLPPLYHISAVLHAAAACCLHVPLHACLVCMQRLTVSQLHKRSDSICVPPLVFKLISMLATKEERGVRERVGGKKEGTVFLTHTALSFCSVTPLRSAAPPFSQSWTTAKKALSYRLYLQHRCFNSMHVSTTHKKA